MIKKADSSIYSEFSRKRIEGEEGRGKRGGKQSVPRIKSTRVSKGFVCSGPRWQEDAAVRRTLSFPP